MKKLYLTFLCVFLSAFILTTFSGCGNQNNSESASSDAGSAAENETPDADTDSSADDIKVVAVMIPHLENPFMNHLSDYTKKYVKAAGFEVSHYVANNDPALQSEQILEAVSHKVDAIILAPCSNTELADAVKAAKDAGIPVVTLHESISTQQDCVSFIGPEFSNGGEQAMTRAMADMPEGGNIAILYGMKGHSAQIAISAGYPKALSGHEDKYPVIAEDYGNWVADDAKAIVTDWLNKGLEIGAIVCNNDGMASGALEAVTEAGLAGKIHIYGLDAQTNVLDAIKGGTISATLYFDTDSEAKKCSEIVSDILSDKPVDPEYPMPMILITAENVDKYLE